MSPGVIQLLMPIHMTCRQPGSKDLVAEELWTRSRDTAADLLASNYWTGTESFHSRGYCCDRL